ncbi:hypothetical protein [Nocardioides zeae]|uniref:Zf-HC2 domain-containing protein n=1 Tax=Nocardioides zeae TaxID=1457234 RepID=A0A6P0HG69_9ACTN|nr:hypothetical protein [Nocardioides zeae]NEN77506.1 hypothetical protein [Nocardioides zeae]
MTILGHLGGTTISDLLDDRLAEHDAELAWAHVDDCDVCQQHLETEAWVKNALSALPEPRCGLSEAFRGRLCDDELIASYAQAGSWVLPPTAADQRRHRWTLAAVGGGAVGAAMLGVVALGATSPAPAPTNRPAASSYTAISEVFRSTVPTSRSDSRPAEAEGDGARR